MANTIEYKVIEVRSEDLQDTLNKYGKEGWELFTIQDTMSRIRLIFKKHA